MTTSNTAVDAAKTAAEKAHEKLAEKRRALGRGLESLLPGPRVVPSGSSLPVVSSPAAVSSSGPITERGDGRAGTPVAPPGAALHDLQAVASGHASDGETVFV